MSYSTGTNLFHRPSDGLQGESAVTRKIGSFLSHGRTSVLRFRFASCAHNLVPINASSAITSRAISRTSSRTVLSASEKETQARARENKRKFAENADNDMRTMCEEGQVKEAVDYMELLHKGSLRLNSKTYAFLLQECAKLRALEEGKRVHALLLTSDINMDVALRNHLLSMYVKCGCLKEAKLMFEAMGSARDVVSWTLMINACAENGQFLEAIRLYYTMRNKRVRPNKITYICLLKACSQPEHLPTGKVLHHDIVKRLLHGDIYVGGAIVDMYFRFGQVKAAREAFYAISNPNAFLWNRLVTSYVQNRKSREALKVCRHMRYRHCVEPTEETWVHVIQACANCADLDEGRCSHFCLCRDGIMIDSCIGEALVHMYISCGSLVEARHVFDQLSIKPHPLWMCLIEAYTECEEHEKAERLKCQMEEHENLMEAGGPDDITENEEAVKGTHEMIDYEELLVESVHVNSV
ncbi:hypothetical protein GOP47_0026803 [Adiantum capillus-veneris]|nr:hypothetical protein GOP47_0026803 [Adiantum capillus-veneris]